MNVYIYMYIYCRCTSSIHHPTPRTTPPRLLLSFWGIMVVEGLAISFVDGVTECPRKVGTVSGYHLQNWWFNEQTLDVKQRNSDFIDSKQTWCLNRNNIVSKQQTWGLWTANMRVSAAKMVLFCRMKSLGYQKRQRLASNYDTRESVARTIRNNQGMLAEAGKLMSGCLRPEGVICRKQKSLTIIIMLDATRMVGGGHHSSWFLGSR